MWKITIYRTLQNHRRNGSKLRSSVVSSSKSSKIVPSFFQSDYTNNISMSWLIDCVNITLNPPIIKSPVIQMMLASKDFLSSVISSNSQNEFNSLLSNETQFSKLENIKRHSLILNSSLEKRKEIFTAFEMRSYILNDRKAGRHKNICLHVLHIFRVSQYLIKIICNPCFRQIF